MIKLPQEISSVLQILKSEGYAAYVVGGCVRDAFLGRKVKDWDIATSAHPEEVIKIFPESFSENIFGTVTLKPDEIKRLNPESAIEKIEITTFRSETGYADKRRPSEVKFGVTLEEDLARRDFTVNAIAFDGENVVDPHNGQGDLKEKIIRAVGEPDERFNEDALRMMRALRIASELCFEIEEKTFQSIKKHSDWLKLISAERKRDEFSRIIKSERAEWGTRLLVDAGLMNHIIPELNQGIGVGQNKHHIYTVYEHNVRSLGFAAEKNFNFEVRLASLLHDIAKPKTKRGEGENSTFYGHEVVGARMTEKILERLKFPRETVEKIALLVRYHLFYYNVDEVTESSVRRIVRQVGLDNIKDLVALRMAERLGSGVPKAKPYKLRHFEYMVEKVSKDPLSPKMLRINGGDVMEILKIEPGPKIGMIIGALMNEVLDDPEKNEREHLVKRVEELGKLDEKKLAMLGKEGKNSLEATREKINEAMKEKYFVK